MNLEKLKLEKNKIIDLQNDIRNHEFDNTFSKNSIKRIISLKVM